jgi:hypothetical protein
MPGCSWNVLADAPSPSRVYPSDILPLMQSLLAALADIDFEHDCEREKFSNSDLEPKAKRLIAEALQAHHQHRREPYVRSLNQLHQMR